MSDCTYLTRKDWKPSSHTLGAVAEGMSPSQYLLPRYSSSPFIERLLALVFQLLPTGKLPPTKLSPPVIRAQYTAVNVGYSTDIYICGKCRHIGVRVVLTISFLKNIFILVLIPPYFDGDEGINIHQQKLSSCWRCWSFCSTRYSSVLRNPAHLHCY